MKTKSLLALLIVVPFFSYGQYTVRIHMGPVSSSRENPANYPPIDSTLGEWRVELKTRVYDANNNLVTGSFTYDWERNIDDGNGWHTWPGNAPNQGADAHFVKSSYTYSCPTCSYDSYRLRVKVTIAGTCYTSPDVRVPDDGAGYLNARVFMDVDQTLENNTTTVGNIGRAEDGVIRTFPAPFEFFPKKNTSEILRAAQTLASSPSQKYNRWENVTDIVNHGTFPVGTSHHSRVARMGRIFDATIQTSIPMGAVQANVQLKDPWLIDNLDSYGPKNRGLGAFYYTKTTPYYPLSDPVVSGVFLNQTVANGRHYSLKAYQTIEVDRIIWNFGYWTASNATIASASSLETSVVFSENASVSANYTTAVKPLPPDYVNPRANTSPGQFVRITWEVHPNTNVTEYQIWRKYNTFGPTLLSTVPRTSSTFTDYELTVTDGYTDLLVYYDVRSHYVDGSFSAYSDPDWNYVFAEADGSGKGKDIEVSMEEGLVPSEFSISSFPNPFNPSTNIKYALTEDSRVELGIFDMLGRKIKSLVSDHRNKGFHTVKWNGDDENGRAVPSGTYFYRIEVQSSRTEGFIRSGKIVLSK